MNKLSTSASLFVVIACLSLGQAAKLSEEYFKINKFLEDKVDASKPIDSQIGEVWRSLFNGNPYGLDEDVLRQFTQLDRNTCHPSTVKSLQANARDAGIESHRRQDIEKMTPNRVQAIVLYFMKHHAANCDFKYAMVSNEAYEAGKVEPFAVKLTKSLACSCLGFINWSKIMLLHEQQFQGCVEDALKGGRFSEAITSALIELDPATNKGVLRGQWADGKLEKTFDETRIKQIIDVGKTKCLAQISNFEEFYNAVKYASEIADEPDFGNDEDVFPNHVILIRKSVDVCRRLLDTETGVLASALILHNGVSF